MGTANARHKKYAMHVGISGGNAAPAAGSVLNAEQTQRRVSGQQTERPVTEPSEAELRPRDEVRSDRREREVSARDADEERAAREADSEDGTGRRVDISV